MMNLFFIMLKLFHDIESKLAYKILRVVRGTLGYAVDATLDDISILHDSPHFVVINKHRDVLINHSDKDVPVTVEKQLERLYPDLVNPNLAMSFFFCHRLDYSTSGILCIAKYKKACAVAVESFAHRKTSKYYLAIVRGHISKDLITVNEGIGDDIRQSFQNIRMALASSDFCTAKWRNATTHIAVLERGYCYNYPATKILMKPITGRRHQLRLHCSHLGHTIVDIVTADPFTPCDSRNMWIPHEFVKSISDAMTCLKNQV
ncbi:RNA pseudouridylate synthase domain-containing protein 1 isoform X2 [Folsomia candida]|uniref:RNA pseudouridylate synthase domain-containing protein 1 isoform X2 n=1 Tax=Folsomia candida TaxID=158441 RepID=UPI000B8F0437|nr:RNA pseudouridylate synthase domain-containing protein 1 isoform X2 [Folsomia candida]